MKTWNEIYEDTYKKLKAKQKKAIGLLKYEVKWSNDIISRKGDEFDIFNHVKVKAILIRKLYEIGILKNEDIRSALICAYMSKYEYELWDDGKQINSLFYDVIKPQLDDIYEYVKNTVNG